VTAPNADSEPLVSAPVVSLALPRTWCVVVCERGCRESWTVDVADFDPELTTDQVEHLLAPVLLEHERERHTAEGCGCTRCHEHRVCSGGCTDYGCRLVVRS
jgi:hypothetical protein